jgi:hypothetical protein
MATTLNRQACEYANHLVREQRFVDDERDDWSEHQPTALDENEFIRIHGFTQYSLWHLGIDDEAREKTKERYKFPFGDFRKVHRCALLSAESRAGQYKYLDIESAAHELHTLIRPPAGPHHKGGTRRRV